MAMLSPCLPAPDPGGSYGSGQHENDSIPRVTTALYTKEPSHIALMLACLAKSYRHMGSRDCAVSSDQGLGMMSCPFFKGTPSVLWPSLGVPGDCRSGKPAAMKTVDLPRRIYYPGHVYDKPGIKSPVRRPGSLLLVDEAYTGHIYLYGPKTLTTRIDGSTSNLGWSTLGKYELAVFRNKLCGERSSSNLPTSFALNMPEGPRTKAPGQRHAPAWLLAALVMMFFTRQSSNLLSVEPIIVSSLPGTLALTAMLLTCIVPCVAAPKNNWSWLQQTSCLLEDPG